MAPQRLSIRLRDTRENWAGLRSYGPGGDPRRSARKAARTFATVIPLVRCSCLDGLDPRRQPLGATDDRRVRVGYRRLRPVARRCHDSVLEGAGSLRSRAAVVPEPAVQSRHRQVRRGARGGSFLHFGSTPTCRSSGYAKSSDRGVLSVSRRVETAEGAARDACGKSCTGAACSPRILETSRQRIVNFACGRRSSSRLGVRRSTASCRCA